MKKITLTVPHSLCSEETKDHLCDYTASVAADLIAQHFRQKGIASKVFKADKTRLLIDYNRRVARNSIWRRRLLQYIVDNNIYWNLDIHSFPIARGERNPSFGVINDQEPELVILDSYNKNGRFIDKQSSTDLSNYLAARHVLVQLLPGSYNDITLELREIGRKCTLLEFNESLSSERLNFITRIVADYFSNLIV